MRATRHGAPFLLAAAYALLATAWLFGNPPFASPDEHAHYVRSLGIARGEIVGEPTQLPVREPPPGLPEDIYLAQLEWMSQFTTTVQVPPGLAPAPWFGCLGAGLDEPATCLEELEAPAEATEQLTHVGRYPPLPYALPSVATLAAGDAVAANLLGRSAAAVSCLLLVTAAVFLLWGRDRGAISLLGIALAVTPMAIFLFASMNPNGLEIASSVALLAAAIRLARDATPPVWVWAVAAAAGVVLALSRTPGAVWIALAALVVVALRGSRGTVALLRRRAALAGGVVLAVVAAAAATIAWEHTYGSRAEVGLSPARLALETAYGYLPSIFEQQVGVFSSLDVRMPDPAYSGWHAAVVVLVAAAALAAPLRQRLVVAGAIIAAVVIPVVFWAAVLRHSFFPPQGRYFLPVAAAVPLLAGEAVFRGRHRIGERPLRAVAAVLALVAASVHLVGWFVNARRWAVGVDGPVWFLGSPEWAPAGTWWPWAAAALAGSLLIPATFLLHGRRDAPTGAGDERLPRSGAADEHARERRRTGAATG